jgi:dTDP-4-dehydro-6-deoxy-alpha-D-glucopyranose 2,3-dehydratase
MSSRSEFIDVLGQLFLHSAQVEEGIVSNDNFFAWFESRCKVNTFEVKKIPLTDLKEWYFELATGNIVHKSGKFFRIEGIDVQTNFGYTSSWMQPIINQPEIGILGFLTKKINGVLHFLVQAKMEPGNVNMVQISPTVQATHSNFTQVHGGKRPLYLDYFLDRSRSRVLVDQLQSEQGARFLRKRNRNMIVQVNDGEDVENHEDFCWLTLGQLFALLKLDNLINMDSRTVLSCIQFTGQDIALDPFSLKCDLNDFCDEVCLSSFADEKMAVNNFDSIISWITGMKIYYELSVRRVPLNLLKGWHCDDNEIRHHDGRFFSVIGVSVATSNREVQSWDQPLIESAKGGVLCFICQKKNGVLHFLVQARVESGNLDVLELAPTLQCTQSNYNPDKPESWPPFYDLVINSPDNHVRYSALQSEEGGRFYHDQNRYLIIEVDGNQELVLPENYIWMTIRQMKKFVRFNNYFNIEARGLLSCMAIKMPVTNKKEDLP